MVVIKLILKTLQLTNEIQIQIYGDRGVDRLNYITDIMINVHFCFLLDYYGSGRFQTAKDAYSVMLLRNKEALSKGFLLTDKKLKDFHFIF